MSQIMIMSGRTMRYGFPGNLQVNSLHILASSRMLMQTFLAFLAYLPKFAHFFLTLLANLLAFITLSCTFSHCLAFFKNFSHLLAYHGSSRINLGQEEEGCGTGGADTKLMTYWLEGAPTRPRRYWTQSTIVVVVITAAVTRAEEWNCSDRECVQGWTKWSFLKLILKLVPEGLILFKRDQLFWFWISHVFEIWIAVFLFDLPWSFLEKPPALDGQTMLNSSTSTLHSLQGRGMGRQYKPDQWLHCKHHSSVW